MDIAYLSAQFTRVFPSHLPLKLHQQLSLSFFNYTALPPCLPV